MTACLAAVLGALLTSTAGPASAEAAGPLTEVVNGNKPARTSGTNLDFVQVTAPAACDSAATRHVTKIVAVTATRASDQKLADAWVGDNLYATSSVGLPGPLTVQGAISWQGMADVFGQKLVPGTYRFVLRCQDNLGTVVFEEWRGGVTFSSPTAWEGFTGATSSSDSTDATGTASASPRATPTASPSGSATKAQDDPSTDSGATSDAPSESSAASRAEAPGAGNGLAATGANVAGVSVIGVALLGLGAALLTSARRRRRNDSVDSTRR